MSFAIVQSWRPSPPPRPLTALVGRDIERAEIGVLLREPANRLLTLTGPGGVGKTRLAIDLASSLGEEFADGAAFISLAPLHDPDLVLQTIGQALGLHESGIEERLEQLLHDRELLLVLDNFEQVVPAAVAIGALLAACPGVTALVTSQVPLGIQGEQQYPLLPLGVPRIDATALATVRHADAVELFVQRARAVAPDFALNDANAGTIATICRHLDGLPLAIELAAARMNILSADALLARLNNRLRLLTGDRRDVPDRLRTMRQAIAWSYDLLHPEERALFRRISVFAGGIPLDGIEAVGGEEAFDLIGRLVDHSLLRRLPDVAGESRFLLLQTLRDYGLEQLAASGEEAEARTAHAVWVERLTADADARLTGSAQDRWFDRYEVELDNLRAALEWTIAHGDGDRAVSIIADTWRFWSVRGVGSEGRMWTERAIAVASDLMRPEYVAALTGLGYLAEDQNDLGVAREVLTRAFAIAGQLGDIAAQAKAAGGLGIVANDQGEYDLALEWHQRAAELAESIGQRRLYVMALANMGNVAYFTGDYDRAERWWSQSRPILHESGDLQSEGLLVSNLAALAMERDQLDLAEQLLMETLHLQEETNDLRSIAFTLTNLGDLWMRRRDFARSEGYFRQALTSFQRVDDRRNTAITNVNFAELMMIFGQEDRAAALLGESIDDLFAIRDQLSLTEALERLATAAARRGRHGEAAELFGTVAAMREQLGAPTRPSEQQETAAALATIAAALDAAERHTREAAGRERPLADAVGYAKAVAAAIAASSPAAAPATHEGDRQPIGTVAPTPAPIARAERTANPLTTREMDVLRLLAEGMSSPDIARALFISPRTATTHVANILAKLEVGSRAAAVALAMRKGIL